MAPALKSYLVDLASASRRHPHLALGMSPRATLALQRVARARAAASGRSYVVPDDLKALAEPVLAHRLLVTPEAQLQGITRRRRPHRGAAGRARPRRQGQVGRRVLTRQGWLVGVGAVALLAAGRLLGLLELFALGVVAAALLVGAALLVRHGPPRARGRPVDPPAAGPRRHRRAASTSPSATCAPPPRRCSACATRCRARAAPTCSCRRSGAAERTIAAYRLPTDRRGLVQIGPLDVVVGDPFGLTSLATVAAPKVALTVYPHVDQIDPLPYTTGPRPARRRAPAELARPHRRGLLRAAALRGGRRPAPHPLAHLGPPRRAPRPPERAARGRAAPRCCSTCARRAHTGDSLEVAVSAAASIVSATARRNDLVRLVTTAGTDSDFAPGSDHIEAIMEHLAVVPAAPTGSLRRSVEMLGRHSTGGALVVIVAEVPSDDLRAAAAPPQPLRLAHDRAHRPLGVGPGRADRPAARRSPRCGSRATARSRRRGTSHVRTSTRRGPGRGGSGADERASQPRAGGRGRPARPSRWRPSSAWAASSTAAAGSARWPPAPSPPTAPPALLRRRGVVARRPSAAVMVVARGAW